MDAVFASKDATRGDDAPPSVVARRYRVLDPIGHGGAATVYRAYDLQLERTVALKLTRIDEDPDGVIEAQARREATLAGRIRHENVVEVHGHGVGDGIYWIAMEYVAGHTLAALLQQHGSSAWTQPMDCAFDILRQTARGLDAIHERGLVHFDVKPANVLLEERTRRAVLVDFGCARERTASDDDAIVGGTPAYMAPEQAAGMAHLYLSPASDVYSLACVAFELLAGTPPFVGGNVAGLIFSHRRSEPPRLSSIRPDLAPLDDILLRAMAKSPDERPASCVALVRRLETAMERAAVPESGPRLKGSCVEPLADVIELRRRA